MALNQKSIVKYNQLDPQHKHADVFPRVSVSASQPLTWIPDSSLPSYPRNISGRHQRAEPLEDLLCILIQRMSPVCYATCLL